MKGKPCLKWLILYMKRAIKNGCLSYHGTELFAKIIYGDILCIRCNVKVAIFENEDFQILEEDRNRMIVILVT